MATENGAGTDLDKVVGAETNEIDIRYALGRGEKGEDGGQRPGKHGNRDGYMELDFDESG